MPAITTKSYTAAQMRKIQAAYGVADRAGVIAKIEGLVRAQVRSMAMSAERERAEAATESVVDAAIEGF